MEGQTEIKWKNLFQHSEKNQIHKIQIILLDSCENLNSKVGLPQFQLKDVIMPKLTQFFAWKIHVRDGLES